MFTSTAVKVLQALFRHTKARLILNHSFLYSQCEVPDLEYDILEMDLGCISSDSTDFSLEACSLEQPATTKDPVILVVDLFGNLILFKYK